MNTKRFQQRLQQKEQDLQAQSPLQSNQEETLASRTLANVQAALRRIAADSYGTCTVCGKEIEAARLAAIPWTSFCLKDQNRHDDVIRA